MRCSNLQIRAGQAGDNIGDRRTIVICLLRTCIFMVGLPTIRVPTQ